jgi:hypothetical protein
MEVFIMIAMFFLHIVDDFYIQGVLAQFKQKSWWEKNYPQDLYKNDYKIALIEHGFSWTFCIMLPIVFYYYINNIEFSMLFFFCLFLNVITHALIDHMKANLYMISLSVDQMLHFYQIFLTWLILVAFIN